MMSLGAFQQSASFVIIVAGLGGEPRYTQRFHDWANTLVEVSLDRVGVPADNLVFLNAAATEHPRVASRRSTLENLDLVLEETAGRVAPGDQVFLVMIGHGTQRGDEAKFNLPGPDLTPAVLNEMLGRFTAQAVAVVNASSSSGTFVDALSGDNRVVITATRSGGERNESHFGGFFVEAFRGGDADIDKDNRVSLYEAFVFGTRETQRFYEGRNVIRTEHALLDDNGDGEGSEEPDPLQGDGALARRMFFTGALADDRGILTRPQTDDPEVLALWNRKESLESQIDSLRAVRDSLPPTEYDARLEDLLIELALTTRQLRRLEER